MFRVWALTLFLGSPAPILPPAVAVDVREVWPGAQISHRELQRILETQLPNGIKAIPGKREQEPFARVYRRRRKCASTLPARPVLLGVRIVEHTLELMMIDPQTGCRKAHARMRWNAKSPETAAREGMKRLFRDYASLAARP